MKYIFHLSLIFILFLKIAHSVETTDGASPTRYIYIIVPGQGDFGGTESDGKLPKTIPARYTEIVRLETPSEPTGSLFSNFSSNNDDFGQQECQTLLHKNLDDLFKESNTKFMIHAYSQGTASILKYISDLEIADQELSIGQRKTSKIEALILESAMISGLSAIYHFTSNHFRIAQIPFGKVLSLLPCSDRLIPLFARKTTFPKFNVNGTQTIELLEHIPTTFPTIILHAPEDYVLPYDGAVAMYQILQKTENNKVYLIPVHRHIHIDLMSQTIQHREDKSKFTEIQDIANNTLLSVINILNKHGISDIPPPENREYKPIFDKDHKKKHLEHISKVRSLHDALKTYYHQLPQVSTLISIAVPMTMLCVSRYIQQRE